MKLTRRFLLLAGLAFWLESRLFIRLFSLQGGSSVELHDICCNVIS